MTFEYADVQEVIKDVASRSVLIGGQALNYWCEVLECAHLEEFKPFVSRDVDFMGSRDDAEQCAKRLGVLAMYPSPGGTDSREAWVEFETPNGTCCLDFLRAPKGLTPAAVERIRVPVDAGGGRRLWVLHPYHCLVCRVINVAALPEKYANDHGLRQLRVSVIMLREFILLTLANAGPRAAQNICNEVSKFSLGHEAIHVYLEHGVDVFEAIPVSALSAAYRERAQPRALERLREARDKYRKGPRRLIA